MKQTTDAVLLPFTFDNIPVRGKILHIKNIDHQVQTLDTEEPAVSQALAELLTSAVMFNSDLKTPAYVNFQIQSFNNEGQIPLMIAQCDVENNLRAYVKRSKKVTTENFADVFSKKDSFTVTVSDTKNQQYQSVVALDDQSISSTMEAYYDLSMQTKTYLRTFTHVEEGETSTGAIFLQQRGGEQVLEDDWNRLGLILDSIKSSEIMPGTLSQEGLLLRLFAEDNVRIHDPEAYAFNAGAHRSRMEKALLSLGAEQCKDILKAGPLEIEDQFSGQKETFTEENLQELFGEAWHKSDGE